MSVEDERIKTLHFTVQAREEGEKDVIVNKGKLFIDDQEVSMDALSPRQQAMYEFEARGIHSDTTDVEELDLMAKAGIIPGPHNPQGRKYIQEKWAEEGREVTYMDGSE